MDSRRLDALARLLASDAPRRTLLRGLGLVVPAALLGLHQHGAAASCKKVGKKCDKSNDCCDGARCKNGECACKNRYQECQGKCYDVDKDERHCGRCNRACGNREKCRAGTCQETGDRGGYALVAEWGERGDDPGQFLNPTGVAVGQAGNLFVADRLNHRIQKLDADGAFILAIGRADLQPGGDDGEFEIPNAVATDPNGPIFVADTGNHRVQKFQANGAHLLTIGKPGNQPGGGPAEFREPKGVAVDPAGSFAIADAGNHRVQLFAPNAAYDTDFGGLGSGPEDLDTPVGVAYDGLGALYIADSGNHRITKFDPVRLEVVAIIGANGSSPGEFETPGGLACDAAGNLFVADSFNHRVQKFAPDGTFLTAFGSFGAGPGQFAIPKDVAVDQSGNVYVADQDNHRIQQFAPV
jgi:DNA-binding beta-propeller fold protein YncE